MSYKLLSRQRLHTERLKNEVWRFMNEQSQRGLKRRLRRGGSRVREGEESSSYS